MKSSPLLKTNELRQKAELRHAAAKKNARKTARTPEETALLLHELEVHQIELEMQNDELGRIQLELQAARSRYFDLFELAPVSYCTLSERGRILEANRTAAEFLDCTRDDLMDRPITSFILPADQDIYYLAHRQLTESGEPQTCELRVRSKGIELWVRLDMSVTASASLGSVSRLVLTNIDERRRAAELMLKAKEKAESAERAKSEFIALVSHELRTPLTVILGSSEMLALTEITPEQRLLAETIRSSGKNLLDLISDVLELTRIEADRIDLLDTSCNLYHAVNSCIDILKTNIEDKKLVCHNNCDPLFNLLVDVRHLRQVVFNLLSNAIKFTREGTITIYAHCVASDERDNLVTIIVQDTGIGIDPAHLHQLFQPFSKLRSASETSSSGAGLGLAISRKIARKMGGDIMLLSAPGLGTAAHFTFRARPLKGNLAEKAAD